MVSEQSTLDESAFFEIFGQTPSKGDNFGDYGSVCSMYVINRSIREFDW